VAVHQVDQVAMQGVGQNALGHELGVVLGCNSQYRRLVGKSTER